MSHRYQSHHDSGDAPRRVHGGQYQDHPVDHPPRSHGYRQHLEFDDGRGRYQDGAPQPQQRSRQHRVQRTGFTLAHAGRHVRVGPIVFWTVVGTLVIMAGWSIVTATYFAFHDDVLARLIAREAAIQFAYEDRIAEMRIQVDRVTSRQLLDQEQFEQKLDQLVRRQSLLESRATTLGSVADPVTTGSIKPPARGSTPSEQQAAPTLKLSPINDTATYATPLDRDARLETRGSLGSSPHTNLKATTGGVEAVLARLQDSLNRIEARQTNTLNGLEESYEARARRMRSVLADLGLDVSRTANQPAVGGPFVPVKLPADGNGFERQIYRINLARAQVDRLNRTLSAVPLRKPVVGEIDTTSSFGVRIDPFVGRPAMHTGLDFRGNIGDPIRAAAGGTITHAGWSGGYGNMVEIDHGNGVATRYGHLSEIEASLGQAVKAGQVIGRLGSSGRSTGPHLHYETRVDGESVDPERFLRAGIRLGSVS
jgi:murein DD-endopeptidase MepM/ murein hydrolase activator NlpD